MLNLKFRPRGSWLRVGLVCGLLLVALGGVACKRSGSSGGAPPSAGSDWDRMHWDEGKWA